MDSIIYHNELLHLHTYHVTTDNKKSFRGNIINAERITGAHYVGQWFENPSIMVLQKIAY